MQTVKLYSPVSYALLDQFPNMGLIHSMEVALSFGSSSQEDQRKKTLGICDVSCLQRFGVKGLNITQWLHAKSMTYPATPNSWSLHGNSTLVLRLGNSEFLVEDQPEANACAPLINCTHFEPYGVVPVQRNDTALILSGSKLQSLLSELCTLDLRDDALGENAVVMTQMAGISVTLLRQTLKGEPVIRLWCDGTYGPYIWHTLNEIAEEHGGGAVGMDAFFTTK